MSTPEQHLDLITALARALEQCNEAGQPGDQPIARIPVVPLDALAHPDGWKACHNVDLTEAGVVEALKMLGAMLPNPVRVGGVDATNSPEDARQFALDHGSLAAQITDVFDEINPLDMQSVVIDHRDAGLPDVIEALDEVLGDRYDPLADEDDDL